MVYICIYPLHECKLQEVSGFSLEIGTLLTKLPWVDFNTLNFNPFQDGFWKKGPTTNFCPVSSTNVGICPQKLSDF